RTRGPRRHRARPGASRRRQSSERALLRLVAGDHDGLGAQTDRGALDALLTRQGAVGHGVLEVVDVVALLEVLAEVAAAGLLAVQRAERHDLGQVEQEAELHG